VRAPGCSKGHGKLRTLHVKNSKHPNSLAAALRPIISRACFALLVAAPATQAFINERTEHYDIYGSTFGELVTEIDRKSPRGFTAYTESEFTYKFQTSATSTGCRVSSLQVDVDITYTMPRWENRELASAELRASWDSSFTALERHEKQHGAIAKQTYNQIIREVRQLGVRDSCGEFGTLVASVFNSALAANSERQRNYDQTTDHGKLEGAAFQSAQSTSTTPALTEASPRNSAPTNSSNLFWYFLGGLIIVLLYMTRRT
jgi:predicted secreted Zn-dependent protease